MEPNIEYAVERIRACLMNIPDSDDKLKASHPEQLQFILKRVRYELTRAEAALTSDAQEAG